MKFKKWYSIYVALCEDGEVRLVEGETEWEGRLEVCFHQRWGTVSRNGWSEANAQVVCSDMGYVFINGKSKLFIIIICTSFYCVIFMKKQQDTYRGQHYQTPYTWRWLIVWVVS